MIVHVDLAVTPAAVTLEDPADCGRFHVAAAGGSDLTRIGLAVGRPDADDHVWVSIDRVRELAAGAVDDSWAGAFAAMLAYAETKGWLSDDGGALRAHVEWVQP
jgi:hypothetical protein